MHPFYAPHYISDPTMMKKTIIALAAILLCACSHKEEKEETVRSVYVCHPADAAGNASAIYAGVVKENENINLGFKTPGQIKRIYVKEGDHVRAGQLIAELDAADYRLGVEALRIQHEQLRKEVERAKRLYEKKSMSANDYEKAVAGLEQVAVQLQSNRNKLAYTRLTAPTAGIIESVDMSTAEMVDAGTTVVSMLSTGAMEVVCDIPASTYLDKNHFTRFVCRSSHDGREIPLRLKSIVPKADSNQLYRMHLAIDGNTGVLTPGMNVEITIESDTDAAPELRLPLSAVFKEGDDTCVWVLAADSTVTNRKVALGNEIDGEYVTITDGLRGDDTVIRNGVSHLHAGDKVRVIEAPSKTNVGGLL